MGKIQVISGTHFYLLSANQRSEVISVWLVIRRFSSATFVVLLRLLKLSCKTCKWSGFGDLVWEGLEAWSGGPGDLVGDGKGGWVLLWVHWMGGVICDIREVSVVRFTEDWVGVWCEEAGGLARQVTDFTKPQITSVADVVIGVVAHVDAWGVGPKLTVITLNSFLIGAHCLATSNTRVTGTTSLSTGTWVGADLPT